MKWSDLSFKEKKQIYDSIKAQNPDTTYLDIKSQFDSIPEYEDGKNRSRWLSDKAYRDSISTLQNSQRFKISKEFKSPTLEELRDDSSVGGNIGNSDGLFTVLDGLEALKTTPSITSEQIENATDSQYNSRINRLEPLKQYAKVGRLIEGTDEYATSSYAEPFTPTITKPTKVKRTPSGERNYNPAKPPKDIEAQAAMLQDTWYREAVNKNQYSNEILRSVDQALYPDEDTRKLVREIDKAYNTNYEKAYSDIAYKEITGRKDYVSYGSMGDNIYGKANMKNIQDGFTSSNVDDYSIVLDPSTYIPGTANHELGHIADGIAGSIKYEAEPGVDYITNPYLRYLADPSNTYTTKELRDAGFHSAAKNKRYLLNPTESKSHMLTLKRALKDSNKISKWSDPVDENMILDYFRSGKANGAVRNQYDLYIDKQRYIDRLNRLVPMEWLLPTIGLGGAEFLREKQNNKSN